MAARKFKISYVAHIYFYLTEALASFFISQKKIQNPNLEIVYLPCGLMIIRKKNPFYSFLTFKLLAAVDSSECEWLQSRVCQGSWRGKLWGGKSEECCVFVAALARQRALMSDYRPLLDLLFNQSRQSFIACLTKKWWRLLL